MINDETDVNDEELDQGHKNLIIQSLDTGAMSLLKNQYIVNSRLSMLSRVTSIVDTFEKRRNSTLRRKSNLKNKCLQIAEKPDEEDSSFDEDTDCVASEIDESFHNVLSTEYRWSIIKNYIKPKFFTPPKNEKFTH